MADDYREKTRCPDEDFKPRLSACFRQLFPNYRLRQISLNSSEYIRAKRFSKPWRYPNDLKAASPHPRGHFSDPAGVSASNHVLKSRQQEISNCLNIALRYYPPASHFVGDRCSRTASTKEV